MDSHYLKLWYASLYGGHVCLLFMMHSMEYGYAVCAEVLEVLQIGALFIDRGLIQS